MKKFLLIAFAALFVGSANAQFANKQTVGKPQASRTHRALPQATFKKYEAVQAKQVKPVADKTIKQLQVIPGMENSVKPINKVARAAAVQAMYEGIGTDLQEGAVSWEMYTGTTEDEATLLVQDVIPNPFGGDGGVIVEYTLSGNNIVIAPQLVASNSAGTMFVYLMDAKSADGSITLTMDNDGNITGTYDILYGAFSQETNDVNNMDLYLGYYSYVQNVKYNIPGKIATPTVSFEPSNLILFAGRGVSGYSYQNNLSMASAYAPVSFRNLTTDKVTEWKWSATRESVDEEEETLTSDEKDFVINTVGLDTYHNISLTGINQTATSNVFTFGVGKAKDPYTDSYVYAGGTQYQFQFSDETYATMTRQDPDGDLTFYTNWGTPDIYPAGEVSKIYNYFEKPATPLYIEGVTLPVVGGNFNRNFNLHIKIYEATYTGSRPTLGRILAEGDATIANVDDTYANQSGLSAINFDDLYVEDEIGMSESVEFLHIDTEFVIVIEGWDNGTFSAVLGSQDAPLADTRTSTWFEKTSAPGSMYSYTGWSPSLFIGLIGATYGWMHTEDDTNVTIAAEGGEATLHIADALYPGEYTWLDGEEDDLPEWLTINLLPGETDFDFDFVFAADALPEGVESREAEVTFVQWGAKLTVKVVQSANGGQEPYVAWVYTEGYGSYSYAFATDPVVKALQEAYNVVAVSIDADTNPTADEELNSTLLNADVVVVCEAMTGNKTMSNSLVNYVGQVPVVALKAYNYNSGRWNWGLPANPSPAALGFTANATYEVLKGVTYEEDGTIKVVTETASNAIQTVTFDAGAPADMVVMGTVGDGAAMYASNAQKFFGLGLSSDCWSYYTENPGIIVKNAVAMLIAGEDLTAVDATGISTVVKDQTENGVVYNLQGQKVQKVAQKGLYIINGKKVVVK